MGMKTIDSSKGKMRNTYMAILIPLGIAINFVGGTIASKLSLPLFLDSIGTAIVAAIMGPFVGAVSGVGFNIISSIVNGNILGSLFGICNIATAFIVGFMARADKFRTIVHAIIATVAVAVANALLGAPIAVVVYGGIQGSGVDLLVAGLLSFGNDILSAAFLARLPINLADKGIACFAAWLILKRLPENMRNLTGGKRANADA
ncbi:energy-coupling factor transport system substrate-specific component [Herbinix hemicellulosilytica]|uniref:Putative membrane protein n=1 Tax=Herbinix hemicellulosilytica TaxID=1564487 RepID=A0A0H5SJS6_HERHM|nr:ECF transporter S component [Herbinix hemicellulosilytica]RBP58519.1 energy-coupling factor transport system substrate-specific component [Herbinix hemicellulosilytica]CRZ35016.1 putative membrane protein [Herbinix hemicellulosilytica]